MNGSLSPIYKKYMQAQNITNKITEPATLFLMRPKSFSGSEVHMIKHMTIKTPYISKYLAKSPSNTVSLPVPAKSNSLSEVHQELTHIGYRKYHP